MKPSDVPESHEPGQFTYHYNRDERVSKLPKQIQDRLAGKLPGGIFRRNRSLLITLISLIIIALVWFVLLPLLRTPSSGVLEGNRFTLAAFAYESRALISLKVAPEGRGRPSAPIFTARFSAAQGGASVEAEGNLSAGGTSPQILRASLPLIPGMHSIQCLVSIGGRSLSLEARVRGE